MFSFIWGRGQRRIRAGLSSIAEDLCCCWGVWGVQGLLGLCWDWFWRSGGRSDLLVLVLGVSLQVWVSLGGRVRLWLRTNRYSIRLGVGLGLLQLSVLWIHSLLRQNRRKGQTTAEAEGAAATTTSEGFTVTVFGKRLFHSYLS